MKTNTTPTKGSKVHEILFIMNKVGWLSNRELATLAGTNETNIRQMMFVLDKNLAGWRDKRVWREDVRPVWQSRLSEQGIKLLERIEAE